MHRRSFLRRLFPPAPAGIPAAEPRPLRIRAGLEPYPEPLDRRRTAHLLRRTGFGAPPRAIDLYAGSTASEVVDALVQEALSPRPKTPPAWADAAPPPPGATENEKRLYDLHNRERLDEWRVTWIAELLAGGLRERLTLFWHNHFVTEQRVYELAPFAYRYVTLLHTHAIGNFKDFVHAVGRDPAMLLYLNGAQNRVGEPNENYARELLELFTMGPRDALGNENYTQEDIEEIARALTGWTIDQQQLTSRFRPARHDAGEKTIFGQTGAFDYDGVIDLLFAERTRQIAAFVCRTLYRAFVYAAPDEDVVADLADVLLFNNFELAPVLRRLFSSAHFMDEQTLGAQIKSPVVLTLGLLRDLDARPVPEGMNVLPHFIESLAQDLLNPPNVAGWPGHRSWLSTDTFAARWLNLDRILTLFYNNDGLDLTALAESLHDASDPLAVFRLPLALAEHLLAIPVELANVLTPAGGFSGNLVIHPIPDDIESGPPHVRDLAQTFLAGTPWYEWNLYSNGAPTLIFNYLQALKQAPDFQLA